MTLRVTDLVGMPHLRLELVAGCAGAAGKVVWAHASDLDTPWQWMTGGELLMKNGRTVTQTAARQVKFLRGLADAKVSGMVIGLDPQTPGLTAAARATADELRLPIIFMPYSVGFAAIGRAVADANSRDEARRLALAERIYDTVRHSVAVPTGEGALRQLSKDLSCRIAVLDAETGETALEDTQPPPKDLQRTLMSEMTRRGGAVSGVIHLTAGEHDGFAVEVPDEEPTVLMAYDFRSTPPDIGLLQHLATAAAVILSQQGRRRDYERRIGGGLLAHLLDARIDEKAATAQLAERDLSVTDCVLVASMEGSEAGQQQLHISLTRRGFPHLLLRRSEVFYALLPSSEDALTITHRRLGPQALIGISDPVVSPGRMPAAQREAVWAARISVAVPDRMARYGDATLLSVLRDTEEAQTLVDRTLGDLLRYDAEHDSDLVHTLDTFLECQRSWQRTAGALDVHRQTVVYRVRRIEQITGRDLSQTSDIAELWLALRARDLVRSYGRFEG
jgi:purine catabolism regulator